MTAYYGGTNSAEAAALTLDEQGVLDVAELQVFYTEAQMSRLTPDGSGTKYALDAKLEDVKARVLYAQWETKLKAAVTETTATETVVTFTPKDGENVRIKATNENDAAVPPEQARRVILAAYRNGQFLGMLPATAETGKIICRIPNDAKYDGCELKIFFLEGGKPTQEMEIVRLYN